MTTEPNETTPSMQAPEAPQAPASQVPTPAGKIWVLEHNRDSLRLWFEQQGLPGFRADQVLKWVYTKGVTDIEKMTDLSKDLRETLRDQLEVFRSTIVRQTRSADGVIKLLLAWPEGQTNSKDDTATRRRGDAAIAAGARDEGRGASSETIVEQGSGICPDASAPDSESGPRTPHPDTPVQVECVMIPAEDRRTACLSTQAGCPVGCAFCASGLHGLQRNLKGAEIVEQLLRLQQAIGWGNRLTHVVIMGMGEPLANFDATIEAIYTINDKWGFGLGARHITVSTVGIPQRIRELADHNLQINLAISLHAPTDALRRQLVPWAAHFKIAEILEAAQYYFDITGREITLEYVLLEGVNDHMTQAQQLAKLAKKIRCSVNLIPYNPVEGLPYKRPTGEKVFAFQQVLRKAGVRAKVRKSRGSENDAACGQLRQRAMQEDAAPGSTTGPRVSS